MRKMWKGMATSVQGEDCIEDTGGVPTGVIGRSSICTDNSMRLLQPEWGQNWDINMPKQTSPHVPKSIENC